MDYIIFHFGINTIEEFQGGKVTFTINEQGKIENAEMSQSSGDSTTDASILESIYKMPNWKPAQNAKGQPVKEKFEFSIFDKGKGGC